MTNAPETPGGEKVCNGSAAASMRTLDDDRRVREIPNYLGGGGGER